MFTVALPNPLNNPPGRCCHRGGNRGSEQQRPAWLRLAPATPSPILLLPHPAKEAPARPSRSPSWVKCLLRGAHSGGQLHKASSCEFWDLGEKRNKKKKIHALLTYLLRKNLNVLPTYTKILRACV